MRPKTRSEVGRTAGYSGLVSAIHAGDCLDRLIEIPSLERDVACTNHGRLSTEDWKILLRNSHSGAPDGNQPARDIANMVIGEARYTCDILALYFAASTAVPCGTVRIATVYLYA